MERIIMKRRYKIAAIVLVILFVFPMLVHLALSNPTSLPVRKGDKIYLGTTTVLGILTFPIGLTVHPSSPPSYTINFMVYTNSTLHGAWEAPGLLVNAYVYSYGFNEIGDEYMGPVEKGVFNVFLNPGEYNLSFYLFTDTFIFWYTTITVTNTIQLIPNSSANATR
jgi:hypothetical protein